MWYAIESDIIKLTLIVKPNAKQSCITHISKEGLQISLHARAHEGEANKALVDFLAELFQTPKTQIKLIAGVKSRHKRVSIPVNAKSLVCLQRLREETASK